MKLRRALGFSVGVVTAATLGGAGTATAGGLFLPGSGAVSTSRAGAAIASVSDGEALGVNPAGIAKSKGTSITLSMAIISYAMEFTRRGSYDPIDTEALPYEGMAFPTVRNDVSPKLGIGKFQPVPVIAIVTDLGGAIPNLTIAAGLYAPNAYPFRDLCTEGPSGCQKFSFDDFNAAPSPARYDIIDQEAAVITPTLVAAYSPIPELDVGLRLSAGVANLRSTVALWGSLNNYAEFVKQDGLITVDVTDKFVPSFGLGVNFRVTPAIELAAVYNSQTDIYGEGSAVSQLGPNATLNDNPIVILPKDDLDTRCATGGTRASQKGCAELALPRSASIGGRYRLFDPTGKERGDVEINLGWENWSSERVSNYRVVVDSDVFLVDANGNENFAVGLKDNFVRHGFQDTYNVRLGGSYNFPAGSADLILRGGVSHDTQAAKDGWLRADIDGAARTTATVGVGYRTKRWEVNVGGGAVFEGTNDNTGTCNPTGPAGGAMSTFGCASDGSEQPIEDRRGPDPVTPVLDTKFQAENPVNQGVFKSSYVLFMLGATTRF